MAEARQCERAPRHLAHEFARAAQSSRRVLEVASIGYLVPVADFTGIVHSVFARACNIRWRDLLLTLVDPIADVGPATLCLARRVPDDLRTLFFAGDPVRFRDGQARSRGADIDCRGATVWRPAPPRALAPPARIARNLERAAIALAHVRERRSSVIDREGAAPIASLDAACRDLDVTRAAQCIERLIGWGEGLTPAGDDFLVGWCAASAALAGREGDNGSRAAFLREIGSLIASRASRTTPIAAQSLRLAAAGHWGSHVHALCDALFRDDDGAEVLRALALLARTGATSGADTATGVLAAGREWLREECSEECRS